MEDHYSTLQVRPTASAEEIERAYRRLARQHHPDLLRDVAPEVRLRAEEVLKRVNRAHRVLGDRERRRAYDFERVRRVAAPTPRAAAPARARAPAPATSRPPAAARTSHWGAGGPIDIEWETPPPQAPRPRETDIFSWRRLIIGAAIIAIVTLILMFLWNPSLGQATPTPVPLP